MPVCCSLLTDESVGAEPGCALVAAAFQLCFVLLLLFRLHLTLGLQVSLLHFLQHQLQRLGCTLYNRWQWSFCINWVFTAGSCWQWNLLPSILNLLICSIALFALSYCSWCMYWCWETRRGSHLSPRIHPSRLLDMSGHSPPEWTCHACFPDT